MKHWLTKILGISLLAASTTLLLSACGSNQNSSNGITTIEFFNQKKEMSTTLQQIATDFEKKNPKIKVKVTNVPGAGDVLKTRVLAGDVPDVINIYPQNIDYREWAKAGYFEDMTKAPYLKNIKNNYAQQFAINGKVYNAPLTANVYGFFYNKTAFAKMGLKVPETWAEFEALVKQIREQGKTPFAVAGTEGWTLNGYHQLALATVAGSAKKANQVLRFSPVNGIKASNPVMQQDFNRLDLLRKNNAAQNNWRGASYNDAVVAFTKGDALIMPNGSWAYPVIQQQKPKFKVGTFAFPGKEKGESLTVGSGDLALSISSSSKHKAAAEKFVAYMTTPQAMQKYYDVDGSPCSVIGVKQAGVNSPLGGITKYAFTKHQFVWLAQDWTSENDFFTLTTNYLLNGSKSDLVNALNAFFNPMKASN